MNELLQASERLVEAKYSGEGFEEAWKDFEAAVVRSVNTRDVDSAQMCTDSVNLNG